MIHRSPDGSTPTKSVSLSRPIESIVFAGLVAAVWFASLARGGNDLWSSSLLFALFSALSIFQLIDHACRRKSLNVPLWLPFLLCLLSLSASLTRSYDRNTTHLELWIATFSAVAFYLFLNQFSKPRHRQRFLLIGGVIVVLLAIIVLQRFGHDLISKLTLWRATGLLNLDWHGSGGATFTNSSVLAGFSLSWIFLFWHFRTTHVLFHWWLAASLITLLLSGSWWGWISLMVGLLYYHSHGIRSFSARHPLQSAGVTLLVAACVGYVFYLKLAGPHVIVHGAQDRWEWWLAAWHMGVKHPFFGTGLGSFATAYPYFKEGSKVNSLYAHSFPLQLFAETGLIGLAGTLGVGLSVLKLLISDRSPSEEANACEAQVVAVLCYSLTSIYLDFFVGKLMLVLTLALAVSTRTQSFRIVSKKNASILSIVILIVTPFWFLPFRASQHLMNGATWLESHRFDDASRAFHRALTLNPALDEGYVGLALMHRRIYDETGDAQNLDSWRAMMTKAFTLKKDIRYQQELSHPPTVSKSPRSS